MSNIETFKENPFASRANGFEVFLDIQKKIKNQIPISMVRLGDGEGSVMGFPEITSRADVDRSWKIWMGDTKVADREIIKLSQSLRIAVSEADIVGLPRQKQYDSSPLYKNVSIALERFNLLKNSQIITDAAIHRHLQFPLLYRALLKGVGFLGIISSRDIGGKLQAEFGIEELKYYPIRGESKYPGTIQERHFPDTYKKLFDSLEVPFPGALFLVGAGVFGKVYCKWIKDRGGIALDIGSIFEPWAKIPSRTMHPCHHLEEYSKHPTITAEEAVKRYNQLCDEFEMDTPRASTDAAYFSRLPKSW